MDKLTSAAGMEWLQSKAGRLDAAGHASTAPELLAALAFDRSETVSRQALRNAALPAHVMERVMAAGIRELARPARLSGHASRSEAALLKLVANCALSTDQLTRLAFANTRSPRGPLRPGDRLMAGILRHRQCARTWLEWGLEQQDDRYDEAVAANPGLPKALARKLIASPRFEVRRRVIINPGVRLGWFDNCPGERHPQVLRALLLRQSEKARQKTLTRLLADPLVNRDDGFQSNAARMFAATYSSDPAVVAALCWDDLVCVRDEAARNPLASELDRIAVALRG